ncbi:hypothetical protein RN001_000826 [Aquatica leii]|uniref:Alanine--tRNA ligase n=1 Tax=Aquatica leii TaxID=1421715 RepID=A0AAN7Q9Y9_9COLE|nr:hypothetical protein RN001_000826 [Aquatica leii]
MELIQKHLKHLFIKHVLYSSKRNISKYVDPDKTSKAIRQCFLNYFINDHSHDFVRSSPVIPLHDASVPFVNAGMNQFKGVFLGTHTCQYKTVANSQKCVRVGGKHNDLNIIGLDGYHHTFFEMLGNWSFGKYFKEEAIQLAWVLLTEHFKIPKEVLYVTYFGGDSSLGIASDLETKHFWRKLGVAEDRILPFGSKDNFWEMGRAGPCGYCTEIHIDRLGPGNRAKFVNKGLQDLTELWNIVFIQFNRNSDGRIERLPEEHVDTGMGLERLTAVLQGTLSNYDTDLFSSIFKGIEKICKDTPKYSGKFGESDWDQLDTNYRILADHARMVTVCLADGVIPDQNQKLKKIMRKVFYLSENVFKKDSGLLKELSNYVVESLGGAYPELERNIRQIHDIILYEEDAYKLVRSNSAKEWKKILDQQPKLNDLDILEMPGLPTAYKELSLALKNKISPELSLKLYDTYGLDADTILKLSQVLNCQFNVQDFQNELDKVKAKSRQSSAIKDNKIVDKMVKEKVSVTDDSYKYHYQKTNGSYIFFPLKAKLLKVISHNAFVGNLVPNVNAALVFDKTNFYSSAGGQISDCGVIKFGNNVFQVTSTDNVNGYIFHNGVLESDSAECVPLKSEGLMEIHRDVRLDCMKNHTATHLVNFLLKQLKIVTCQKSSKVTPNYLNFDVGIFNDKLTIEELENIEKKINLLIEEQVEVLTYEVDGYSLHEIANLICIPGEVYPSSEVRVIEIKDANDFLSREPCCGTHVLNVSDIEDFCFIGFQSLGRATASLHAVTGDRAKLAKLNGEEMLSKVSEWESSMKDYVNNLEVFEEGVSNIKESLKYSMDGDDILPISVKHKCLQKLNSMNTEIKRMRDEFIETEMKKALEKINEENTDKKFIVHYLKCSKNMENIPLHKATKVCRNLPVLVISYSDNVVKARCCVPKDMKSPNFDAEKWLENTVTSIFRSAPSKAKDQDTSLVCNMKGKKVDSDKWDMLLKKSIEAAKHYAEQHLKQQ